MATIKQRLRSLEETLSHEEEIVVVEMFADFYMEGTRSQINAFARWFCKGGGALAVNPGIPIAEDEARKDPELAAMADTHPDLFQRVLDGEITPQSAKSNILIEQWNAFAARYSKENPLKLGG